MNSDQPEYSVDTVLLTHESSTKFYEMVGISTIDGRTLLLKRWGKIQFVQSGGQVKEEIFDSLSEAAKAWNKTLDEKNKRGYSPTLPSFGFHGLHPNDLEFHDDEDLLRAFQEKYAHGYNDVLNFLDRLPEEKIELIKTEIQTPIVRSEDWASW